MAASGAGYFTNHLVVSATADHASVDSMILSRTYTDFVSTLHLALNPGVAAAANDFAAVAAAFSVTTDVALGSIGVTNVSGWASNPVNDRVKATVAWLVSNNVTTLSDYCWAVDSACFNLGEPLAGDFQCVTGSETGVGKEAPDGLITIEFNYTHSFQLDQIAAGVGLRFRYGAAVDPTDADDHRSVIMFWKSRTDFFSHEAGHHVFLPHAKYPLGANAPGGRPAQSSR